MLPELREFLGGRKAIGRRGGHPKEARHRGPRPVAAARREPVHEILPVGVIPEDVRALDPSSHHVMEGPRRVQAGLVRHTEVFPLPPENRFVFPLTTKGDRCSRVVVFLVYSRMTRCPGWDADHSRPIIGHRTR